MMKNHRNKDCDNLNYKGVATFTAMGQISYFLPLSMVVNKV